ncbi:beach-domain-containing protein [Gloeophyllum trabeum ATCC 11539]|uniref:Beach-domain-containing protein n=1 Tax=Gloeophyllum trabeum (strain ATCC 11539 / FP-39264 / Madison 617) TaxID=670483 RepID=S7PUD2_GLOTA|nr:beach-domain-containing protein [Gloeophyllum trabeum ATCC 11539]EPQ51421.1 beach-domain-containing protein [Gloeophyllum trabeum ATCC 11539]
MLRTLLTPLVARFDLSPRLEPTTPKTPAPFGQEDNLAPEDFARDVLVELMRNGVERLKVAEDTQSRIETLSEIHRVMGENRCTKDVFREMDGFLVVMSVLSTVLAVQDGPVKEPEEQVVQNVKEASRYIFTILSEAMYEHNENATYFERSVGYDSFRQAVEPLILDKRTTDWTLGLLLSLALHNFLLTTLFSTLRKTDYAELTTKITDYQSEFRLVRYPPALRMLWDFLPDDATLRLCMYKILERLSATSHRNKAILSSMGVLESLVYVSAGRDAVPDEERAVKQKLLKRLLDMGATPDVGRMVFQKAIRDDGSLDFDTLEVLRAGMKSKWPDHFSMESRAALCFEEPKVRGLPVTGFTFMGWLWFERFAQTEAQPVLTFRIGENVLVRLSVRADGKLQLRSTGNGEMFVSAKPRVHKSRWIHITLVHYPHRVSNPTIRIYIDGVLTETLNWQYPKSLYTAGVGTYLLGDDVESTRARWCITSTFLLSSPLGDDLPRLVHHLGPRYDAYFQSREIVKFLTYEAATSLNIYISGLSKDTATPESSALLKAIKGSAAIGEQAMVFALHRSNVCLEDAEDVLDEEGSLEMARAGNLRRGFRGRGDVRAIEAHTLDVAMWRIGGPSLALKLIQLASNPHEVSRALGVLTEGLRNSWQNSEDMERLRGYDVLGDILRAKSELINVTGFEILFEFLGMNFRNLDHSTIVNTLAYRAIALDFELWSRTKPEIQRSYMEHFVTLLSTSKHKRFNAKQRFAKLNVVRKLLFVLQTNWYRDDMTPSIIGALKVAAEANFTLDDAIKPIISFLAANLHEVTLASPKSVSSVIDSSHVRERAERVLEILVDILSDRAAYNKFTGALPATRIYLLLLGDRPSPAVAKQILLLIGISINISTSFIRKFELVSGWNMVKTVLPYGWDYTVHPAAFGVLLGTIGNSAPPSTPVVACPQIMPAILASMQRGLTRVSAASGGPRRPSNGTDSGTPWEPIVEALVEELINLQATSPSFRQIFKSQQTTQQFIEAFSSFVKALSSSTEIPHGTVRLLEKLSHFGLSLALDNSVGSSQKRELLDLLQSSQNLFDSGAAQPAGIDPNVIVGKRRPFGTRMLSARLSLQVGERVLLRSLTRISDWRKTVIDSERKRLRKTVLDLREHHRAVSRLHQWMFLLDCERSLWAKADSPRFWRLDETEGPYRVRKKLEPEEENTSIPRLGGSAESRLLDTPDTETQVQHVEVPPWAETYEISATDVDGDLAEEIVEDKHRRVRHELEPGDVIEGVCTVARIAGVDSSPGLLILGRTHLYMLDGLVEKDDGEVIDAKDAPKKLFLIPGSILELNGPQRAQRWPYPQINGFSDRTFLFRGVGLEFYFRDNRSLLVVFPSKQQRMDMTQRLSSSITSRAGDALTPGLLKTPLLGKMSARVLGGLRADELASAQSRWQAREISNFTYLSIINQVSGRTPADATQYPIFPWVLQDYSSESLDLTSPSVYRDLSKPMGALTGARREAAIQRYTNLESVGEQPFHYGTHFSSSMIVCHFLIRLSPFTHMFKTLQGGDWDLPDRLFIDLGRAYDSAAKDLRGDVRELIPEFYTCPEFLENSANIDFGVQQQTGERIHDVKLPPWAKQDPLLFIEMNRRALESDYVSENLPAWIDLIWGCKQRDPESLNVFHPLSYEGSIDLDSITDDLEREATVGIIHNFGQTPRKLFTQPHPRRYMHGLSTLPLGTLHGVAEDYNMLHQSHRPIRDLGSSTPVQELVIDLIGEKIVPCAPGTLCVPSRSYEQVEWGPTRLGSNESGEIRVVVDRKVVQVAESVYCTCAAFADSDTLVTGSSDHLVRLWQVPRSPVTALVLLHTMRAHTAPVTCVAASKAWSIAVSGSRDGSAVVWDLNRGSYVRSMWHDGPVEVVAINESMGHIATCSATMLALHTINGRPIATLSLGPAPESLHAMKVTSLAFLERDYTPRPVLAAGSADGRIVLLTWGAEGASDQANGRAKWVFRVLRELKVSTDGRIARGRVKVTALKFVGEILYHGEDTGRVYSWDLPD